MKALKTAGTAWLLMASRSFAAGTKTNDDDKKKVDSPIIGVVDIHSDRPIEFTPEFLMRIGRMALNPTQENIQEEIAITKVEKILSAGKLLARKGQYTKAIARFDEAIIENPSYPIGHFHKAKTILALLNKHNEHTPYTEEEDLYLDELKKTIKSLSKNKQFTRTLVDIKSEFYQHLAHRSEHINGKTHPKTITYLEKSVEYSRILARGSHENIVDIHSNHRNNVWDIRKDIHKKSVMVYRSYGACLYNLATAQLESGQLEPPALRTLELAIDFLERNKKSTKNGQDSLNALLLTYGKISQQVGLQYEKSDNAPKARAHYTNVFTAYSKHSGNNIDLEFYKRYGSAIMSVVSHKIALKEPVDSELHRVQECITSLKKKVVKDPALQPALDYLHYTDGQCSLSLRDHHRKQGNKAQEKFYEERVKSAINKISDLNNVPLVELQKQEVEVPLTRTDQAYGRV